MENNNEQVQELQRELAKAQAENADLRAQIDAQHGGFDFAEAMKRIEARNASDAAYQAEMEKVLTCTATTETKYI